MATRIISTRIAVDGEKEYKQQMSSVNSELKTLKTELSLTEAEFRGQANSVEALTAKDKILRQEVEQQQEKVRALEQAVADATEAYGENDKRADQWKQSLNRAKTELINLNDQLDENSRYLDEAQSSADGAASSIDEYGNAVKPAEEKTVSFKNAMILAFANKVVSVGVDALVSGMGKLKDAALALPVQTINLAADIVKRFGESVYEATINAAAYADTILTESIVTGLSTDALQEYQYMAELTDTSVETITGSLTKLTRNMETAKSGTGSAADAFSALGIHVTNADGSLRSNQEVFGEVLDALSKMTNETQRDAYAMEIFGKSAQELNPLMAVGSEGVAALAEEAHNMGYVLDEDTLGALGAVDDAFQRFQLTIDAAKNQLGAEFAPVVEQVFTGFTQIISGNVDEGIETLKGAMDTAAEILNRLGPAAQEAVIAFIESFSDHLPEIAESGTELILTLLGAIAKTIPQLGPAAVAAITTIFDTLWEHRGDLAEIGLNLIRGLGKGLEDALQWLKEKVTSIGKSIKGWFADIFDVHSPSRWSEGIGEYIMEGLSIGLKNGKGDVMKTVDDILNEIKSRFDDVTNVMEGRKDVVELQYQLWEMTDGNNASELQKHMKRLEILGQQEKDQAAIVEAADAAYQSVAKQYGENSEESLSYQKVLLQEKIAYEEILQEIQDLTDAKERLMDLNFIGIGTAENQALNTIQRGGMYSGSDITAKVIQNMMAQSVNALASMQGNGEKISVETKLNLNGQEFARAILPDLRAVQKSTPEASDDR